MNANPIPEPNANERLIIGTIAACLRNHEPFRGRLAILHEHTVRRLTERVPSLARGDYSLLDSIEGETERAIAVCEEIAGDYTT
jgi:hypothetical protein